MNDEKLYPEAAAIADKLESERADDMLGALTVDEARLCAVALRSLPRPSEQDEAAIFEERTRFVVELRRLINYWSALDLPVEQKVGGVVHSVLVCLDGCSGQLPGGYTVVPELEPRVDLGGDLHEYLHEGGVWRPTLVRDADPHRMTVFELQEGIERREEEVSAMVRELRTRPAGSR